MKLAVNYSKEVAELFTEQAIPLDIFKCPDWPHLIEPASQLLPIYVHFPLQVGQGLEDVDRSLVDELFANTPTQYVNVHLEPLLKDFPNTSDATKEKIKTQVLKDLEQLSQRYGTEKIIVENIPYRKDSASSPVAVDTMIIQKVLAESGCGFLLDVSHARLSAMELDIDEHQYLSELPNEKMKELHVTGIAWHEDRFKDHLELSEKDWEITDWVFNNIHQGHWARPDMVAFEYGGFGPIFEWRSKKDVLAEQVPRLYDLVHRDVLSK